MDLSEAVQGALEFKTPEGKKIHTVEFSESQGQFHFDELKYSASRSLHEGSDWKYIGIAFDNEHMDSRQEIKGKYIIAQCLVPVGELGGFRRIASEDIVCKNCGGADIEPFRSFNIFRCKECAILVDGCKYVADLIDVELKKSSPF